MRYFGLDEANRLVPLLSRTFDRVRPWVERVQSLEEALETDEQGDAAHVQHARAEREQLLERIRRELAQLQEMGLEIKAADGLVDFRARLGENERPVYLCWRFGESSVTHWHELQEGFAGRRPIANPDEFIPVYLS